MEPKKYCSEEDPFAWKCSNDFFQIGVNLDGSATYFENARDWYMKTLGDATCKFMWLSENELVEDGLYIDFDNIETPEVFE